VGDSNTLLTDYASRLLAGTGISPAEAAAVAAGDNFAGVPGAAAAAAMRDGWQAAAQIGGAQS
jgi:hypothetical protein